MNFVYCFFSFWFPGSFLLIVAVVVVDAVVVVVVVVVGVVIFCRSIASGVAKNK